ncbi:DUF6708 domain-containing protein [Stenotrophomonas sp. MMGLT7]|uniref:DUF6708 domain-containing protein n=1 Tax=Stenotrophomonas sp. MMGLT7 TaxID=2901227 RepID=UPI001E2DB540|nr:DUF6708 domain-containing protein [Stenotrophomonas sp. MMGLT7]MCD7099537.1 hypothetical protein [Stenotrophomonas sp. MMGLT7]
MHYQGMIPGRPFPVNRPLTEQDRKYHLRQGEQLEGVTPYPDLIVIKLNSTYLEVVDKYYGWRGWAAFMFTVGGVIPLVASLAFIIAAIGKLNAGDSIGFYFGLFFASVFGLVSTVAWFLGRFEWAYYTHYPIRLNRKTQTVHVFRKNGSVLSVPWKELFFTLDHDARFWEIRGHVLGNDGETVKETFALGSINTLMNPDTLKVLRAHWEFFRRYMEEGTEAVAPYVKQALPVDGKRESFHVGYEVLASHFRHGSAIGAVIGMIGSPIIAVSSLGRWVAMRLSKVPQWPSEIEAVNMVDPDDPVRIDARINPPELR